MSAPVAADRLKAFVERIERLREERAAITTDEREVFNEAKSAGFDTKAMRKVIQRRATDPAALDEMDALIELYEGALGGKGVAAEALRAGATIREAAKAGGISTGAAAALARVQNTQEIEHPQSTAGETQAQLPRAGGDPPPTAAAPPAVEPDPVAGAPTRKTGEPDAASLGCNQLIAADGAASPATGATPKDAIDEAQAREERQAPANSSARQAQEQGPQEADRKVALSPTTAALLADQGPIPAFLDRRARH